MIREVCVFSNEIRLEGTRSVDPPYRVAVAAAVVSNPFAGRYVEDLSPLIAEYGENLAQVLVPRALAALSPDGGPVDVACYGKATLVGTNGEIEHGSAIIHSVGFGGRFRQILGGGEAMIPSVEKRGPAGASLDVPVKNRHDAGLVPYHQTLEIRIPDGPAPDEIIIAAAVARGPRPHPRSG